MGKRIILLALCAALAGLLTGCRAGADQRTGEAEGYGGPLRITLSMVDGDITKVRVVEHHETQGVGTRAIDTLPAAIEKADSIDVEGVSGATVTSDAIKAAVSQAIGQSGVMQEVIPLDSTGAAQASAMPRLTGAGMAATGRIGPGKDEDGGQVYSFNIVFACGQFEEDGVIRAMKVDQLEIVTPNLGGGSAFSGFPGNVDEEDRFLTEVAAWTTKGALGDGYKLASGSWRAQMDLYEQAMAGKTVAEVRQWYEAKAAQPQADVLSGATMALQGEYGDILLAIERAWEDAQRSRKPENGTLVDTNTLPDATHAEPARG